MKKIGSTSSRHPAHAFSAGPSALFAQSVSDFKDTGSRAKSMRGMTRSIL